MITKVDVSRKERPENVKKRLQIEEKLKLGSGKEKKSYRHLKSDVTKENKTQ